MITRHRATASVITVGKLHQLVRSQRTDPADLSSLRALLVSGSPLSPSRLAEALEVLGPALRRLVAESLGEAAVPQSIRVIDRVPVAPSGKPDKASLPI